MKDTVYPVALIGANLAADTGIIGLGLVCLKHILRALELYRVLLGLLHELHDLFAGQAGDFWTGFF